MGEISELSASEGPKVLLRKPAPALGQLKHTYTPAPTEDLNLLILFHGLGDSLPPFTQLGKSLNLPQTAVLCLQGPEKVPLLEEEECWQWYASFDQLGEPIQHPNPTKTITLLHSALSHLVTACSWPPSAIHLFGFAQGGTCALELALAWNSSRSTSEHLGSIVTVSGPLLSFPTGGEEKKGASKMLSVCRKTEERSMNLAGAQKGFKDVKQVVLGKGEGMPRGRDEWMEIMRFWANTLTRKSELELQEGVYELHNGMPANARGPPPST